MTVLVHLPGPVVGGEVQFCSRCSLVLLDISERNYASTDGGAPSFWPEGTPLLVAGPMSLSLLYANPDRDTSDEIPCKASA